jgi:hypothetical protein
MQLISVQLKEKGAFLHDIFVVALILSQVLCGNVPNGKGDLLLVLLYMLGVLIS